MQTTPSEFIYIKNWIPITPNTMPLGGKKSGTVFGGGGAGIRGDRY